MIPYIWWSETGRISIKKTRLADNSAILDKRHGF
jgi:hypothetical protein